MDFFITVARCLAAILITNAHYENIYPLSIIANGGLLGDVIFFAVSGYCLYNISLPFYKWYFKRIVRIYPLVWLVTIVYILLGFYEVSGVTEIIKAFIYPTHYHFVASIMILYILYYVIIGNKIFKSNLGKVIVGIAGIYFIVYIFWYDKSVYDIDNVRGWMIRFLFLESMLLGAWFKKNKEKYIDKNSNISIVMLVVSIVIYFTSKLLFVRYPLLSEFQILNQIILFIVLYYFIKSLMGINNILEKMPSMIKQIIKLISEITLEIYIVQYVIIDKLENIYFFPFNFIIVTITILVVSYVLNKVNNLFIKKVSTKIFMRC